MTVKFKKAMTVFSGDYILLECPFCGTTLIRTNYDKVRRLLYDEGVPRGKACEKCGKLVILKLNREARRIIVDKLSEMGLTSQDDPTVKI